MEQKDKNETIAIALENAIKITQILVENNKTSDIEYTIFRITDRILKEYFR